MSAEINLLLSAIGTLTAISSAIYVLFRTSKMDTKDTEKRFSALTERLGKLELSQMTPKERLCLQDISLKMNLFWSIIEKDFPKLLKQETTPELDVLLDKITNGPLTTEEHSRLVHLLDVEYNKATAIEDSGRAMALALYKATLTYKPNPEIPASLRCFP